jgi:MICOS complex subunit MIC12
VRWVQHTDWDEVREGLESRIAYLYAKATGQSVEEVLKARRSLEPVKRTQQSKAGGEIAAATRGAFGQAKETAETIEMNAENRALDARLRSKKFIEETAAEAKDIVSTTLEKGREKAKEVVDRAKTAVGLAEEKVEELVGDNKSRLSPVQQALRQRYEKPSKETRTVAEILKERYIPLDQRDNTVLRGL